jgi:signal transduction histidine kinase
VAILVQDDSVTIEDEGPGISEQRAATLFDRPTDHRAAHGRGLPLARRLAESDGGRLELTQFSPPAFRLTLVPLHQGSDPGCNNSASIEQPAAAGPGVTTRV